jgi:hypothetical protein
MLSSVRNSDARDIQRVDLYYPKTTSDSDINFSGMLVNVIDLQKINIDGTIRKPLIEKWRNGLHPVPQTPS